MKKIFAADYLRIGISLAVLLTVVSGAVYFFERASVAQFKDDTTDVETKTKPVEEAVGLNDFRETVKGEIKPVIVELQEAPGAVVQFQKGLKGNDAFEVISNYAL